MEHNHGGLEDHFPFQMGDGCRFQPLIFQGVPDTSLGADKLGQFTTLPKRLTART